MKKTLLFLIPIILLALVFLAFSPSLTGRVLLSSEYAEQYPYSAEAEIEEKERTHRFTVYSDGQKTLLQGNLEINGQQYPAKILYDGQKSYLFRPDPNQAVYYNDPAKAIYGFLPPHELDSENYNITIVEKDSSDFPLQYKILDPLAGEESVVTLKNLVRSPAAIRGIDFRLPEDTKLINAESVLKIL